MILHKENEGSFIEKVSKTYVLTIDGWYAGAFTEHDIENRAKENKRHVNDEAIAIFRDYCTKNLQS